MSKLDTLRSNKLGKVCKDTKFDLTKLLKKDKFNKMNYLDSFKESKIVKTARNTVRDVYL